MVYPVCQVCLVYLVYPEYGALLVLGLPNYLRQTNQFHITHEVYCFSQGLEACSDQHS